MLRTRQEGFTLIELIAVIVVLAVLSVGIAGFIRTGTDIYVDVAERDQVLSEGRFVVQRLNREIRNALPNSLRVSSNASVQCLEFVPVLFSSYYFDIPVAPEPQTDQIKVIKSEQNTSKYNFQSHHSIIVYPTSNADVYGSTGRRHLIKQAPVLDPADDKKLLITLSEPVHFVADSPSSRAYAIGGPVSYCASESKVWRFADYAFTSNQQLDLTNGVLMAENLVNSISGGEQDKPFRIAEATLSRNAFVLTLLRFELNQEQVVFNNEVHIPNAP
ncbi:type II secretion system protein [Aliiglaciecola sp. LCG003]|uniref:PulJ/GspJ family protein n=1 Tax=Aliiglaciecola sp. LCG003 TaxID=3053655 RepID=UPI002573D547|nr:type II secretion system protein [Aliiglaciecola sp. LCG003]WJG09713.1 type II secretion system protein [Aliiglaciecola sp. LCG003]